MRFSTFLNARSMSPQQDRELILGLIDHSLRAEELGFDAVFLPDHHFNGYMPIASDPMMFAAYLAGRLKQMHFGFSVTSVPLHSPVRFAERVNILDQLTEGRLLVGVGSGTTPEEMIGFGVDYKTASAISDENLAIAEQLWAKTMDDAPVKFDNGPYKGEVLQRITPAQFGSRHARLMPVALKEASMRRAAENAWPAFIPSFTPPQIYGTEALKHVSRHFTNYRTTLEAAGHAPELVADALSWTTATFQCVHIAESEEQAKAELIEILTAYQEAIDREDAFNARAESTEANRKTDKNAKATDDGWIGTWCLYGSPETVIEKLQPYADMGIGNILCGLLTGPYTTKRVQFAEQSMRHLSETVMPHFRQPA